MERLFAKRLAPNDNSKNQIYLGGEFSVLSVLPSGELSEEASSSGKRNAGGKQILKAQLPFHWLDADGRIHAAPNAQLILYPQYPEVRLSGMLSGSSIPLGEWFDPRKQGRAPGRVLFFGVSRDGKLICHLALPGSTLDKQLAGMRVLSTFGAISEIPFLDDDGSADLLRELTRINKLGWISSKRLDARRGVVPCDSPNCGGYTLEAELGISPNGFAEPDYRGWEVKTFGVSNFRLLDSAVITLMTPEPDGGLYKDAGVEAFIRRYGYADVRGREDRMNVGGVYVFGRPYARTALRLTLTGFDRSSGKIQDVNSGIALMAETGECAALWTYRKLIDHWKKKHDKAVYVPNFGEVGPPRRYQYGDKVFLGRGGDFSNLLAAVIAGSVYYDPGIKMEGASGGTPKIKRRSQFRIKSRNLKNLYGSFETTALNKQE